MEGGVVVVGVCCDLHAWYDAVSHNRVSLLKAVNEGQVNDWNAPFWGLQTKYLKQSVLFGSLLPSVHVATEMRTSPGLASSSGIMLSLY